MGVPCITGYNEVVHVTSCPGFEKKICDVMVLAKDGRSQSCVAFALHQYAIYSGGIYVRPALQGKADGVDEA
jgi:hypothetical protein